MDSVDKAILAELKHNGRASAASIAKAVALSVPAVLERMRKLKSSGIINGYTVRINRLSIGQNLLAFIFLRLGNHADGDAFRSLASGFDCVLECHHIAGAYDYLLKVAVENTEMLEHFLTQTLKKNADIAETNTMIVLATQKEEING